MKNKKIYLPIIVIVLAIIFFSYAPVVTYDSSHYLWLTNMLTKNDTFANWDIARGLPFPLLIYISNIIFGHDADGILILMFIFYLAMILSTYLILKKINHKLNIFDTTKKKTILGILVGIFVVFNPIIFGYYHTLLTEFIATTLAIISCYFTWNWFENDFEQNRKNYILNTVILAILTAFAWNLKQPYVGCAIFPVIIAALISIIKNFSWKNIIQRLATILTCMLFLVISILTWNKILELGNVQMSENRQASSFINDGIINGVSQLDEIMRKENVQNELIENAQISQKEKQEIQQIIKGESKYKNFVLYENRNEKSKDIVIFLKNETIKTGDAIKLVLKTAVKTPITLIRSYTNNYLGTINIYKITFPKVIPEVTPELNLLGAAENEIIGYRIYDEKLPKTFSTSERYEGFVEPYKADIEPIRIVNITMKALGTFSTMTLKISFIILPIVLIGVIIIKFRKRKVYDDNKKEILNVIIIFLSFSLIHVVFHAVLASTIDRYTVPAIIPMFISYIIIGYLDLEKFYKIKK